MKRYILAFALAVLITQPAFCKTRLLYDRFTDTQIVKTRSYSPFNFAVELAAGITDARINFFKMYKLKDSATPLCGMTLQSISNNWVFLRSDTLFLLVDGQKFQFNPISEDRNVRSRFVSEVLSYDIPCDALKVIADSELTEGRVGVGTLTFTIKENAKSEISEILSFAESQFTNKRESGGFVSGLKEGLQSSR